MSVYVHLVGESETAKFAFVSTANPVILLIFGSIKYAMWQRNTKVHRGFWGNMVKTFWEWLVEKYGYQVAKQRYELWKKSQK